MANFVLAGKTDCPYYAKAEMLADSLQRSLPNFRIHKISILPEKWQEWLEATSEKRNGWKHKESPLVWRELVFQGGKKMFIGGFSDFLEHCRYYYNMTSDMPSDVMLSIAAENLETKMNVIAEEQHHASLIKPLNIWITSAHSPTCNFLIPSLLSAEVFPNVSAISLHLLDLDGNEEELQQLMRETEDLALGLLHQVTFHTNLEEAFQQAEVIILLDDWWADDRNTENQEEKVKEKAKRLSERYRQYGYQIDQRANKDVKAIVSGDSYVNLRCSVLVDNTPSIDNRQFVAVANQLESKARAIIAKKLKVRTSDVTNVIVWGNISGSFYIDLQRAKVFNYDGAIKGPAFFSQPVLKILHDRKWLETDFQDLVHSQRAGMASKMCRTAAMSSANGILTLLKAWNGLCGPDEVSSAGIHCPGYYDLPGDIVFSVPVTFTDGKLNPLLDVTVTDQLKERLQHSASEIRQEKELGSEICKGINAEDVN